MGAVVENPSIFHDLTAFENLKMQYDILDIKDYSTINDLLKLVGLENTGKKMAKNFSLGMTVSKSLCSFRNRKTTSSFSLLFTVQVE